jgi:NAD(P)-dependent dehydrogenase (short-subunit alcohol dehydrogenase family)
MIGVGGSPAAASVAADLYEHTIDVIDAAEAVGRYQALPESDLFDMEYWSLEQAKLGKQSARVLEGRIVFITGAARGIGAAAARAFARAGASLYLVDLEAEPLAALAKSLKAASEVVDVADEQALRRSLQNCALTYGGLDGVVSNAGFAPQSAIATCPTELLQRSFAVNFFAHQWLASEAFDLFQRQGIGGFLLFNASKAAFNPGPGFGPYALPKAALVALMKQYALEGGALGIRANAVNADRIRTGLRSADDVERRAAARGLEVDAYFRSNLLGREVTAGDVADAFVFLATAESTTGCVVTVDGGNLAASPR